MFDKKTPIPTIVKSLFAISLNAGNYTCTMYK